MGTEEAYLARLETTMADALQPFTIELSPQDIADLKVLVERRGLSANAVLQQAISTERLISDNVKPEDGDKLLIKKANDTFKEIVFKSPASA